jgi:hypothetical protein
MDSHLSQRCSPLETFELTSYHVVRDQVIVYWVSRENKEVAWVNLQGNRVSGVKTGSCPCTTSCLERKTVHRDH